MAATRAVTGNEARGIAIAVVAHVVIIGLLSVQWTAGERRFDNPPMEVDLVAETAPESSAPIISEAPPAPRLGEEDAVEIAAPEPQPVPPPPKPLPEPVVRPKPAPSTEAGRPAEAGTAEKDAAPSAEGNPKGDAKEFDQEGGHNAQWAARRHRRRAGPRCDEVAEQGRARETDRRASAAVGPVGGRSRNQASLATQCAVRLRGRIAAPDAGNTPQRRWQGPRCPADRRPDRNDRFQCAATKALHRTGAQIDHPSRTLRNFSGWL